MVLAAEAALWTWPMLDYSPTRWALATVVRLPCFTRAISVLGSRLELSCPIFHFVIPFVEHRLESLVGALPCCPNYPGPLLCPCWPCLCNHLPDFLCSSIFGREPLYEKRGGYRGLS